MHASSVYCLIIVLIGGVLTACGGKSNDSDQTPHPVDNTWRLPVYHVDQSVAVGIVQDDESIRSLSTVTHRGTVSVGYGSIVEDLGPWETETLHLVGTTDQASFGVAMRNGHAEPWAYGDSPAMAIADNPALSGVVNWNGAILGVTPQASTVTGDAEISIDLSDMSGRADFTELESFPRGQPPGTAGSGTQWLDGDLGYDLFVHRNTFVDAGGDDGRITGILTGANHHGVAGTLERSDLTAAFGATR